MKGRDRDRQVRLPDHRQVIQPTVLAEELRLGRTVGRDGRIAAHRLYESVQVADGERAVELTLLVEAREGDRAHWTQLASTGERDQRAVWNGVESPLRLVGKPLPDEVRADDRLLTARLGDAALVLEDEPVADALRGAIAS